MAILKDNVIPLGNYAPNTYQVGFGQGPNGPLTVPDTTTSCDISLQRCTTPTPTIWPETDITIETIPECSADGGVTWIEAGRSKPGGGISFKKDGVTEEPWSRSGGSLPSGTNRLWRCTVIVVDASGQNRSVHTSARVEVD
jgi:hypothetical protein